MRITSPRSITTHPSRYVVDSRKDVGRQTGDGGRRTGAINLTVICIKGQRQTMIGDDPCDDDEQDRSEDRTLWYATDDIRNTGTAASTANVLFPVSEVRWKPRKGNIIRAKGDLKPFEDFMIDLEWPRTSQNRSFSYFFTILSCDTHFKSELRIKLLLFYCMLCTDCQSDRTAAIARHVSFAQITCCLAVPVSDVKLALSLRNPKTKTIDLVTPVSRVVSNYCNTWWKKYCNTDCNTFYQVGIAILLQYFLQYSQSAICSSQINLDFCRCVQLFQNFGSLQTKLTRYWSTQNYNNSCWHVIFCLFFCTIAQRMERFFV